MQGYFWISGLLILAAESVAYKIPEFRLRCAGETTGAWTVTSWDFYEDAECALKIEKVPSGNKTWKSRCAPCGPSNASLRFRFPKGSISKCVRLRQSERSANRCTDIALDVRRVGIPWENVHSWNSLVPGVSTMLVMPDTLTAEFKKNMPQPVSIRRLGHDDYPAACPLTCTEEMRFNLWCDLDCDSAACNFDAGECPHEDIDVLKYTQCAPTCPISYVSDGWCDPECNSEGCHHDGDDCAPRCAPSCVNEWRGDEYCDEDCNTVACGFDGGDCKAVEALNKVESCPSTCSLSWIGDGFCDTECNNPSCNEDGGDCNKQEGKEKSCNPNCPPGWVADGICDKECFSSECKMDGGDCQRFGAEAQAFFDCAPECNSNWLGDGICDDECDTKACKYDLNDCPVPSTCSTIGAEGVGKGKECVFPFKYMGVRYDECTTVESTTAWCSTEVNPVSMETKKGQWGNCNRSCNITCVTAGRAGVGEGKRCMFPFVYKGKTHNDCALEDSDTPWCATKTYNNLTMIKGKWGECSHACELRALQGAAGSTIGIMVVLGLVVLSAILLCVVLYMRYQVNHYKRLADIGDGIPKSEMKVYGNTNTSSV